MNTNGHTTVILLKALQVMVLTPKIAGWLQANDPKALEQAMTAIERATGQNTPPPPLTRLSDRATNDIVSRALSVILESEGADEHGELIGELRHLVAELR